MLNKNIFDVKDKIVVVTGGLGQLGRQFSLSLLENGAKVVVFDTKVNQQKVRDRFGEKESSPNLFCLQVDITDKQAIENALGGIVSKWGIPHALINNAALDSPPNAPAEENGPFETYPETSWDEILKVNVKGVFLCCQVIGGKMAESGSGSIVNICSIYGISSPDQRVYEYKRRRGMQFFKPVAYSASKSSIVNLTRYLATYWAEKGIRVNTLTFGGVYNHQEKEFLEEYCKRVPLGRMAREDEYNGAVIFLVSDASSYMTGSNLIMDGGWTAW